MDIKTKLEDDKVLFLSFLNNTSRSNMLKELNTKGISTVEDFINADIKIFNSASRHIYNAMIHVLRNAYLNEPFVYDVLLKQKYSNNIEGIISLEKDIRRLGLIRGTRMSRIGELKKIVDNYSDEIFTMEYILKNLNASSHGPNLKLFYINYLEKSKENNQALNDDSITSLSKLKVELQTLINMKNELDQKIDILQEKINNLEAGDVNYDRK